MPNARLIRKASFCFFAVLTMYVRASSAAQATPGKLTAEVSQITYQSHDQYLVEITIKNTFIETVALNGYELNFFAQSEALGQWIELRRTPCGPGDGVGLVFTAGRKWKTTELVIIPLADPHLFRNHDGDVNLLFRYNLKSTDAAAPGEGEDGGESAYWVTPRTDRWVLREGM